jgi:hypothetical protein
MRLKTIVIGGRLFHLTSLSYTVAWGKGSIKQIVCSTHYKSFIFFLLRHDLYLRNI